MSVGGRRSFRNFFSPKSDSKTPRVVNRAEFADTEPTSLPSKFGETGVTGIKMVSGMIREAYLSELTWPSCIPRYQRLWRSDPECTFARHLLGSLSYKVDLGASIPDQIGNREVPISDDDKRARDFLNEVLDDVQGGISSWLFGVTTKVPFFGWGWWETVLGPRIENWRSPDQTAWRSQYKDGLVGVRKLGFRDYSSFVRWNSNDRTGEVLGLVQQTPLGEEIQIPMNRSNHIVYGDLSNPEGLATLEALWRLERIKYGLEIVQGIGFEHAAGYLDVTAEKELSDTDKANVKRAARAIMTAQEGNYALWPAGFKGELKDVPFSAAASILEAIRYYGILKLALFGVQWAAIGSLSGTGSYSSMQDSSSLFITSLNSMIEGFVDQLDSQMVTQLFNIPINKEAFPGMTRRPRISMTRRIDKSINLPQLAQFLSAMDSVMPLGDDDYRAIRQASEVLPPNLPEKVRNSPGAPKEEKPEGSKPGDFVPGQPRSTPEQTENEPIPEENLASRPFGVSQEEDPMYVQDKSEISSADIEKATGEFRVWAKKHRPDVFRILDAEIVDE